MSIFGGLGQSKTGNTHFEDPDWPSNGSYIILVKETDLFTDRDGQACVTVVAEVLSSQPKPIKANSKLTDNFKVDAQGVPFITPNAVGRPMKFFWKLERNRRDELTFRGQYEMNRFKGFLSNLLGGAITGVTDEQMTEDVALAVCIGSSRLAQSGDPDDRERLAKKVQDDFKIALPNNLINLAGAVMACEVNYSEYTPKQGKNEGRLVSSTEVSFAAMTVEDQKPWIAARASSAAA